MASQQHIDSKGTGLKNEKDFFNSTAPINMLKVNQAFDSSQQMPTGILFNCNKINQNECLNSSQALNSGLLISHSKESTIIKASSQNQSSYYNSGANLLKSGKKPKNNNIME